MVYQQRRVERPHHLIRNALDLQVALGQLEGNDEFENIAASQGLAFALTPYSKAAT